MMCYLSTLTVFFLGLGSISSASTNKNCKINNDEYISGSTKFSKNCMEFNCFDGKWFAGSSYKALCSECRLSNDPHITTFDGAKYDWHGDCTYVVAEEVDGRGDVVSYVHNKFTKCGGASCVDTVYFKARVGPLITVLKTPFASTTSAKVEIEGYSQSITTTGREMQVLKGLWDVEYPVLAYWMDDCLHIIAIDTQDFLVKVCSYFIKIFAPRMHFSKRTVSGMCGSPNDGTKNSDLKLRNGHVVQNPNGWGWSNVVDSAFAEDWQVRTGTCGAGRRKISTDNEPCKATDTQKSKYIGVCKNIIGNDLSEDITKDFIDGCAFDQCIITETGANDAKIKDWLNEWSEVVKHEVFEQENHEDYYSVCPGGFFNLEDSKQCFKFYNDERLNWTEAKSMCKDEGLQLAEPSDEVAAALRQYLLVNYGGGVAWVGAQGDGRTLVWQNNGNVLSNKSPLYLPGKPNHKFTTDDCLLLLIHKYYVKHEPESPYTAGDCVKRLHIVCEKIKNPVKVEGYDTVDHTTQGPY